MDIKEVCLFQDLSSTYFKSDRLRKNIKASLTATNIAYSFNKLDKGTNIAHFLYPFTSSQVSLAYNNNKKIVMSLFYTEGEEKGGITSIYNVKKTDDLNISTFKVQDFYKADKILVPYEEFKKLLIKKGVRSEVIEVISAGSRYGIYKYLPEKDMELASRYFSFNENDKIIVSFGNIKDKNCLNYIYTLAKLRPDVKIVFLVTNNINTRKMMFKMKLLISKKPNNVIIESFNDINIYRSLLKNCRCLVYFNEYLIDEIQLFEAFAAELQVIAYDKALPRKYIESNIILHSDDIKDVYKLITDFLDYKISNTIQSEFDYVTENSVENIGNRLKEIYQELQGDDKND